MPEAKLYPMSLKTAITVPVYKPSLSEYEVVSFTQVLKVLKDYDIILVCPDSLDVTKYLDLAALNNKNIEIERFDSSFFEGIDGYNRLMLSLSFYQRFEQYSYILVYQTDCFLFRDELEKWVSKGYDYIGAPWLHNDRRSWWTFKNRIRYTLKTLYRRYLTKGVTISLGYYKVGNGGLSLRKVDKSIEIIKKFEKNKRINRFRNSNGNYLYAEDVFWGCEVNRYFPHMKIPVYKEALGFSFDMNPSLCYELNKNNLPFGCHAWYRYELDFWRSFIEKEGFTI